jgi:hypothetical protein
MGTLLHVISRSEGVLVNSLVIMPSCPHRLILYIGSFSENIDKSSPEKDDVLSDGTPSLSAGVCYYK